MEATDKEPSILLQGSPFPLGELQVRWKYVDIHVRNTGNTYVHEKKTYVNLWWVTVRVTVLTAPAIDQSWPVEPWNDSQQVGKT